MPKISAIIPVYNTERYLTECVDSIAGQTLRDIEIVCVNDGSTDTSEKILAEYAQRDARVVIVTQENQGLSAARNSGVSAATGDYLYFIDSDDHLALDALEKLYEEAARNDLDVLYFDAVPFFEDADLETEHAGYRSYYERSAEYLDVMSGRELLATMAENNDYKPSPCLQLIRRSFYEAAGLSFYVGILHEDHLFSLQCALSAGRAEHVPWPCYQRRIRGDSIMTVEKSAANFKGFFISYLEMMRLFSRGEYDDATSAAIAKLCSEMYRQALKIFMLLPAHEREAVGRIDTSPEARVTYDLIVRQANETRKLQKYKADLKTRTKQLEKIRGSWPYRAARRIRSVFTSGR
jgi:glycosyltransferase involved in cell wall biosynthesis